MAGQAIESDTTRKRWADIFRRSPTVATSPESTRSGAWARRWVAPPRTPGSAAYWRARCPKVSPPLNSTALSVPWTRTRSRPGPTDRSWTSSAPAGAQARTPTGPRATHPVTVTTSPGIRAASRVHPGPVRPVRPPRRSVPHVGDLRELPFADGLFGRSASAATQCRLLCARPADRPTRRRRASVRSR
jgi:hypothetical protein